MLRIFAIKDSNEEKSVGEIGVSENERASVLHTRRVGRDAVRTRWGSGWRGRAERLSGVADGPFDPGRSPTDCGFTFVTEADASGEALLLLWHQNGARIRAASPESRALLPPVLCVPIPPTTEKQGWLQRLKTLLLGPSMDTGVLPPGAEIVPAPAEHMRDDRQAPFDIRTSSGLSLAATSLQTGQVLKNGLGMATKQPANVWVRGVK